MWNSLPKETQHLNIFLVLNKERYRGNKVLRLRRQALHGVNQCALPHLPDIRFIICMGNSALNYGLYKSVIFLALVLIRE